MSFDNSRFTFKHRKNYSGVVSEQGRVQMDADWNEWLAQISRRTQAGTLDEFGHAAYPPTTPWAFLITATSGPNTVTIGPGRMYVDGLLAENHGAESTATWDPALAELSNTPQPPDLTHPNPNPIDFTKQPYYPGATVPTDTQSYVFYLDVWTRDVTYLEDEHLVDKAVGVDATGRLQTVWQVKWMANPNGYTCATPDSQIFPPPVLGQLTTGVVSNTPPGPCCLTDSTGYTGQENQFYRVEIHQAGTGSDPATGTGATFKWSRENASVETLVLGIAPAQNSINQPASALTVASLGRDEVLGFHAGDWIEILDDWTELWGQAGVLCQIDSVNVSPPTITLTTTVDTTPSPPSSGIPNFPVDAQGRTDPKRHTRIRRWDQRGKVYDVNKNEWCDVSAFGGAIPVPASDTTLVLENGVTVQFQLPTGGNFRVGDYWTFAARTADGSVEKLDAAPPRGIHHHCTKLSIVTFGSPASYPDCRPPSGGSTKPGCGCCTVTVGDGVNSIGQYTSIQAAINALPSNGGEVAILPGRYYEYVTVENLHDVVIRGCGSQTRLASPTMNPAQNQIAAKASPAAGSLDIAAIVTVSGSTNVELRSFAIEAADGEAGILVDWSVQAAKAGVHAPQIPADEFVGGIFRVPSVNVTISELAITASTLPALIAAQVQLLKFADNRVAMEDVRSQWPAVWVSGVELHVERNWIGLQDGRDAEQRMPVSVINDVPTGFNQTAPDLPVANGGIQVGGYSTDVFIVDNEIEGGARNGISLGSFRVTSASKKSILTQSIFGLLPTHPSPTATTFTLELPAKAQIGNERVSLFASGLLANVLIARNRIRNFGLCGIGPAGFFDLQVTMEVITAKNLTIADNAISSTLQAPITPSTATTLFGYGAICVADAENLVIRDNVVTDFGDNPGAAVCGVFVLCGEQVEARGNQILETRDWAATSSPDAASSYPQAGIMVTLATLPALDPNLGLSAFGQGSSALAPLYQPGLPAVRIEDNVVRVALGRALEVVGFGPFAIDGNQLGTGGTIQGPTPSTEEPGFMTVFVMNLGLLIEAAAPARFSSVFNAGTPETLTVADNLLEVSSSGSVLFRNNRCQLETRASGVTGGASVAILSLDHVVFSDNHLWLDGPIGTSFLDALVFSLVVQATGNRFQEAAGATLLSAWTFGFANITTNNLATYCIVATAPPSSLVSTPNIILDSSLCANNDSTRAQAAAKETVATGVRAADEMSTRRIQGLSSVHQARLARLQRTATYVTAQYGESSPQAKAAQAAVTVSKSTVQRVAALKLQRSVTAPSAAPQGWSLYGHVYGAQLQPASAYTVFVVDAQNAYQAGVGFAYTASDGSYKLDYTPAAGATLPAELFLQIANDKAQPVYLGSAPLKLQTGAATPMDITLPAGEPVIGDPPAALRAIAFPPAGRSTTKPPKK